MPESPTTALAHVATLRRLHDAVNSGDPEPIAATVEQVARPTCCSTRRCRPRSGDR
ncbi:hypothetical protein ACFVVU_09995 [Kitasatospora sp. NPDC057965]|uniref:hypothetical protein n=1 Tax=Kitasatospora sp. NPDC057965 TaxID=3346291 RepID=UPI0036DADF2C